MSALVQNYGQHEGLKHTEPIFDRLYQCFEISKNPIRETLLIAVGSMGRYVPTNLFPS
jgi:serine/threonine-protein kinase ATR